MKDKLTITIPHPCSEKWDKMGPAEKGRFCASCQKTVIDFSALTDAAIMNTIKAAGSGNLCGHFHPSQLNREVTRYQPKHSFVAPLLKRIAASLLFFQVIATTALAQKVKPKTHQQPKAAKQEKDTRPIPRGIRGCITDYATNEPLPGLIVKIAGTDITAITTTSGTYFLPLHDSFDSFHYTDITLHVDTPYIDGTFIMDETIDLNNALATDVMIYRYPADKLKEFTKTAYKKPLVEMEVMGATISTYNEIDGYMVPQSAPPREQSLFYHIGLWLKKKHKKHV